MTPRRALFIMMFVVSTLVISFIPTTSIQATMIELNHNSALGIITSMFMDGDGLIWWGQFPARKCFMHVVLTSLVIGIMNGIIFPGNNLRALIKRGLQHDHNNIIKGAESLQSGQQSIANYHRGDKATNALIEGKNCATKLDFRQRFGVRIWRNYENLAIVCRNSHLENDQEVNYRNVS
ncbi:hypothetical protein [Pasteuria penetrans]|uniref:hypothetical protein n=1 Tax=Pasteuria penetrans TaxID=86005 RepID=UPI0011EDF67F|nr:hypothetical protein [Pasteuria penetrans]